MCPLTIVIRDGHGTK